MPEPPQSESASSAGSSGGKPVGSGDIVVQPGDCISSLAHNSGHFWQTIWNHPDNAELKRTRKDPNILLPGDRLTIPPISLKEIDASTDKLHQFVRKGEPAKLRLRVMTEDDESEPQTGDSQQSPRLPKPRASQPYILVLDGIIHEGHTDADGMIELYIPPGAQQGRLTVGPDNLTINLVLGGVDPIESLGGVQGRLNNLGFNCGDPSGEMNNSTRAAVKLFQRQYNLAQTGTLDDATRQKLKDVHGS